MIVWQAGIDDSGTHNESSNIVAGAVLAQSAVWADLIPKWKAVLKDKKLPYFHSADFNNRTNTCKGWSRKKRDECVIELLNIINPAELEFIAYTLERKLFESNVRDLEPYEYLLVTMLGKLMNRGTELGIEGMFAFVENHKFKTPKLYDKISRRSTSGIFGAVRNISMVPKEVISVQVADIIAYESYKRYDNIHTSPEKSLRPSFIALNSHNDYKIHEIDKQMLEDDMREVRKFLEKINKADV